MVEKGLLLGGARTAFQQGKVVLLFGVVFPGMQRSWWLLVLGADVHILDVKSPARLAELGNIFR